MPNSEAPSIVSTTSTSRGSGVGGVKLTPSGSEVDSTASSQGVPIDTPSTTSNGYRTPTASVVSTLPTTSVSLNAVFARLEVEEQRKALRSLQKPTLSKALGCEQRDVYRLMVTATSDELWAAFCQLNVESRKKSLESVRKFALRQAFFEENGDDALSIAAVSYSASIAPSEATTNTLASALKKLNVKDQEKALAAVRIERKPKKGLRRGGNGWGLDDIGGAATSDNDDTLLDKPDLAEWQELCRACGVEVDEIPGSIKKCKEILKTKNVALSDLSVAIQDGTVAQTFPSLNKLRKYVQNNNKVANKAATKQNRFLKKMLRELFRYRTARLANGDED